MHSLEKHCLTFIRKHSLTNKPLLLAYSAGIDSQVLLTVFSQLVQKGELASVDAIHIHHGISQYADDWAHFAQEHGEKAGIKVSIKHVQLQGKGGVEAVARKARYLAIAEHASKESVVITGHHLDDQAETFLLALKRGAGVAGLSGMAEVSKLPYSNPAKKLVIARPLLDIARSDVEDYASVMGLSWVDDESNADHKYDRNFIRHNILSPLKQRWPSILTTIARTAENCRDADQLLLELAKQDIENCHCGENTLTVSALSDLSEQRFNNLIRYFLTAANLPSPSKAQLKEIRQMLFAEDDKNPQVCISGNCFRRYKNALYLTEDFVDLTQVHIVIDDISNGIECVLPDDSVVMAPLCMSGTVRLRLPQQEQISVQFSHCNPDVWPHYRDKKRSMKKVLQELNIPPWERKRIPLIYFDDTLVAAVGYFVDKRYLAKSGESGLKIDR